MILRAAEDELNWRLYTHFWCHHSGEAFGDTYEKPPPHTQEVSGKCALHSVIHFYSVSPLSNLPPFRILKTIFVYSTHHNIPIVLYSGFTCFSLIFSLFLVIKLRKIVTILNTHFYLLIRPIILYRLENLVLWMSEETCVFVLLWKWF